jgi:sugar porter (SP) family MFS transporter
MMLTTVDQELVVSLLPLGAVVGAIFSGLLSDRLGRKKIIFYASIVFTLAAFLMAFAPNPVVLFTGRFAAGVAIGISSMTVPLYISELSPPQKRGLCVSTNQLMVTIGILAGFGIDYLLGHQEAWRLMLGISACPAIILFISLFFLPETPRWLVAQGRVEEAKSTLLQIGTQQSELAATVEAIRVEAAKEKGTYKECFAKGMRMPLFVGVMLAIFQQIVGINTVIYYAPTFLVGVGEKANAALLATVGVGVVNVVMTILTLLVIDVIGRRKLLLVGTFFVVLSLLGLSLGSTLTQDQQNLAWIYVISLFIYVAGFAIGLGPIAWLFIAEAYPLKVRSRAMSIATIANWGSNFVVAFTFLTLLTRLGEEATFGLYGVIAIICLAFFYFLLPETKQKTLEEISAFWRGKASK